MRNFKVVIPTRDSSKWVGAFLNAYRSIGVEPLYIVDARSEDNTLDILYGMQANFFEFIPLGDFAEAGMLEFGSRHSGTKWVLRMDDDEFPTLSLLKWVQARATNSLNQAWLISRRETFLHNGRIYYSRSPGRFPSPFRPAFLHPQERLYHLDRVKFIHEVHTSGFESPTFFDFAPTDAFFIHCNCLLRTPSERLEKIRKYESIKPMSCWGLGDEYLPEQFDFSYHSAQSDGLREFARLFDSLPIDRNAPLPPLTEAELSLLFSEVTRHRDRICSQAGTQSHVRTSADDFKWIHLFPKSLWKKIGEFLCTFGHGKLKSTGVAIWNYDLYHHTLSTADSGAMNQ